MKIRNRNDYRKHCELYFYKMVRWDVDALDRMCPETAIEEMERRLRFVKEFWKESAAWKAREQMHLAHVDEDVTRRESRGFCSPIKTEEIRIFEHKVEEIFGSSEETATTAWDSNDLDQSEK